MKRIAIKIELNRLLLLLFDHQQEASVGHSYTNPSMTSSSTGGHLYSSHPHHVPSLNHLFILLLLITIGQTKELKLEQLTIQNPRPPSSSSSPLHPQLKRVELLHTKDIKFVNKGNDNNNINDRNDHKAFWSSSETRYKRRLKEVTFSALNQTFRLILSPDRSLIANPIKVFSMDTAGLKKPFSIKYEQFYEGKLIGQENSEIRAHFDEETGLLSAAIFDYDKNEVFMVEPYWRHFSSFTSNRQATIPTDDAGHNFTMIVYKASDVKHSWTLSDKFNKVVTIRNTNSDSNGNVTESNNEIKSPHFCDHIKIPSNVSGNHVVDVNSESNQWTHGSRTKRKAASTFFYEPDYDLLEDVPSSSSHSSAENSRCSLYLVADYTFFEAIGRSNMHQTVNFLTDLIQRINVIYTKTKFGDSEDDPEAMTGMGFVIQEILVHTGPTTSTGANDHYNVERSKWDVRELLEVFSRNVKHDSFCLAHLFTHRKFDGAVLGLAYVASPHANAIGGICSQSYYKNKHTVYFNSGVTTTQNSFEQSIITHEVVLVTAHEFGHNWGAEHDPDIEECSPTTKNGGSYLMNTFSLSGFDPNNKLFSPCSRRSIKAVLKNKAPKCFLRPQATFCGNNLVEAGEECDEGMFSADDPNSCCDSDCQLKPGRKCSDKNSPCCNRCQYVRLGERCRDENPLLCTRDAYCDGFSAECPKSNYLPDDTVCLAGGRCRNGKCLPYCEARGLHSCLCNTSNDECKRCCRVSPTDPCFPFRERSQDQFTTLADGTTCIYGFCDKGRCRHVNRTDVVYRVWDIAKKIDANTLAKFFKNNIVGVVIFITLLIWIPGAYFIESYDKKFRLKVLNRKELIRQQSSVSCGQRSIRSNLGTRNVQILQVPRNDEDDEYEDLRPPAVSRKSSNVSRDSDSGGFSKYVPRRSLEPSAPPSQEVIELVERPEYNESDVNNYEERMTFTAQYNGNGATGYTPRQTRVTQKCRKNVPVTDL